MRRARDSTARAHPVQARKASAALRLLAADAVAVAIQVVLIRPDDPDSSGVDRAVSAAAFAVDREPMCAWYERPRRPTGRFGYERSTSIGADPRLVSCVKESAGFDLDLAGAQYMYV